MTARPLNAHEPNEEEKFLASSMGAVRECVKPLIWSWAIGLGGVLIGMKTSESLIGLLYIVGVIGLFAAVVVTIFTAWIGAPVLVARVPQGYRAIAKFGFVILWASVPLWVYYFTHDRAISISALLDYVEFRGFFVAKLFIVGIFAFAMGRQLEFESYRSVQPYVLIPIGCIFLGGWLAPEEDRAAWRTGLTVGLVYYVGVTLAVSLGFHFGQHARQKAKVP